MIFCCTLDMSTTAFVEPLPVVEFVTKLLNRDVTSRPLSDSDRVKVRSCLFFPLLFPLGVFLLSVLCVLLFFWLCNG